MEKNLSQLFDEYINECKYTRSLRPETIKGYRAVFDHFSKMMPEVNMPQLLTVEILNEFFKRIKTRIRIVGINTEKVGLEDSTIKTYGNKLNAFFVWLVQRGKITSNPLDHIRLKHPEYKDQRALKKEEIEKMYTAVALHSSNQLILRRDIVMISLLYFCGLRTGEFISLKVSDIDMEKRFLTVRAETSKSKKSRHIPIHSKLLFYLKDYISERRRHGYRTESLIVSSESDKGLSRHGFKHWVKKIIKTSGVKFHPHCFRHSFACALAEQNVGIVKIQKLMGHADPKMTMTYLRSVTCEDMREDIDKICI